MKNEKYIKGKVNKLINECTDKVHKITDDLERKAAQNRNIEVIKQDAYNQGYEQACEDFSRYIRCSLPDWLSEAAAEGAEGAEVLDHE